MEVHEFHRSSSTFEQRAKIEAALVRLKALRCRIAEVRAGCESLRDMQAMKETGVVMCAECGGGVDENEAITIMDDTGSPRSYYHKDCLKAIWNSQTWRFDYSAPEFLKRSERSR